MGRMMTVKRIPHSGFDHLLGTLRTLIQQARQQALRAVDAVQVRTCWEVGRHIVEFEQRGLTRAVYGSRLLSRLAERLTADFGRGFDECIDTGWISSEGPFVAKFEKRLAARVGCARGETVDMVLF